MHTLRLKIDDSVFDKFMGLLDMLPKDKVSVLENVNDNSISFEEAKTKVQKAINNIPQNSGINFDDAFDKVLNS